MAKSVEKKAMRIVMKYEKINGRRPKDVSKKRIGYDIESDKRLIEVKGQSRKEAGMIGIHNSIVRKLGKRLAKYHIYIVYNINKLPRLRIIEPDDIFKVLETDVRFVIKKADVTKYGKIEKL